MDKVEKKTANKKAIYLNNDHGMLPNGKYLLKYLLNQITTLTIDVTKATKLSENKRVYPSIQQVIKSLFTKS